jgi:hypothetical protein
VFGRTVAAEILIGQQVTCLQLSAKTALVLRVSATVPDVYEMVETMDMKSCHMLEDFEERIITIQ